MLGKAIWSLSLCAPHPPQDGRQTAILFNSCSSTYEMSKKHKRAIEGSLKHAEILHVCCKTNYQQTAVSGDCNWVPPSLSKLLAKIAENKVFLGGKLLLTQEGVISTFLQTSLLTFVFPCTQMD